MLEQTPSQQKARRLAREKSSLPSNEHYLVLTIDPTEDNKQHPAFHQIDHTLPQLIVFRNEETTFGELIATAIQDHQLDVNTAEFELKLKSGYPLPPNLTVDKLKTELRRPCIDGLEIHLCFLPKDRDYEDEACLKTCIEGDPAFNHDHIALHIHLPSPDHHFYLPLPPTTKKCEEIAIIIHQKITEIFQKNIPLEDMELTCHTKTEKKELKPGRLLLLNTSDKIEVVFKKQTVLDKPKPKFENTRVKIQGREVEESCTFCYDQIRELTVETIFKEKMRWKGNGTNPKEFGLRFFEYTIKACEKLSDFQAIDQFLSSKNKSSQVLVADIISQVSIFFDHYQQITHHDFDLTIIYQKTQLDPSVQSYFRQIITDRSLTTNHLIQQLTAIFYYTCELTVHTEPGHHQLYDFVNQFLRNTPFGYLKREDYRKWHVLYISRLLSQSALIHSLPPTNTLYRGVSYPQKNLVGDTLLMKSFSSTSSSRTQALNFAKTALLVFHNVSNAKPIQQYSYFPDEEEILVPPYTQFRITAIKSISHRGRQIQEVLLEEIPHERLRESEMVYLLWVSGKKGEGLALFQHLSPGPGRNTSLVELYSNDDLQQWIDHHRQQSKDRTISFVLFSNMTRIERGKQDGEAGIETIRIFRNWLPNAPIFLYVGWIEATLQKLSAHKMQESSTLHVSNSQPKLLAFMQSACQ